MNRRLLLVGQYFAGYRIEGELGAGGMGVVYRAWDPQLQRTVALKLVRSAETEGAHQRLLVEARAASALDHPNVASVHALEQEPDGDLCIVMAYYEGETIGARLKRGPLAPGEAIDIARQIACGLDAAHRQGIIHRDIKPSNVLLTKSGIGKILDFGIARTTAVAVDLTEPGTMVGTLAYMSPEQIRGDRAGSGSDLWALGVVLYEMLTGRHPFPAGTAHELRQAILQNEFPEHPLIPEVVRAPLRKALAKREEDRFSSATAMGSSLEAAGAALSKAADRDTEHVRGAADAKGSARPKYSRRLKRSFVAAAIAVAMIGAGAAAVYRPWAQNSPLAGRSHVTLAVLPFKAQGDVPGLPHLAEGLSEALAQRISNVDYFRDRLAVVSSSELISRNAGDPVEAKRRFGANMLASGILRSGKDSEVILELSITEEGRAAPAPVRLAGDIARLSLLEDQAAAELSSILTMRLNRASPKLSARRPVEPEAYRAYLSGLGLLQRWDKTENLSGALQNFGHATRLDPQFAAAWVGFADAARTRYTQSKDPSHLQYAFAHAQQAVRMEPGLAAAHVVLGRVYSDMKERDLALVEYKRALEIDNGDLSALAGVARTLEQLQRQTEAAETLERSVRLHPYSWTAHNHLANFYYRAGRLPESERAFRRCLELSPDNAGLHSNLGAVLFARGNLSEAAEHFRASLRLRPTYQASTNLGNVYYRQQRFKEAAEAYGSALQLANQDFRIWGSHARALSRLPGRARDARDSYLRAIQIAEASIATVPPDASTRSLLSLYHAAVGNQPEAEKFAGEALAAPIDDNEALINIASAFELIGQEERAVHWVEEALRRGYAWRDVQQDPDLEKLVNSGRIRLPENRASR